LIEIEGFEDEVTEQELLIKDIINEFDPIEIKLAATEKQRELFWKARKGVLGALGRLAPNYYLVDGTVPRTKLAPVLSEVNRLSKKYGLIVANVLHAGDGNLHPCIIFDQQIPGNTEKALSLGGEILKICVDNGGVLSGEHGIGYEKKEYMPLLFSDHDLEYMKNMKNIFDSKELFNPGKIFPSLRE
jgi:glycolate oxidase